MTFGVQAKIESMESILRTLERKVEQCELREKQLIIMFKMMMDKLHNTNRNTTRGGKAVQTVTMKHILDFMEQLINKNLPPEEKRDVDLLGELIKKGR